MEDLIDIQGLDYIGWWPLALGWWWLIGLSCLAAAGAIFWGVRWYKYRHSWQFKAFKRLDLMLSQVAKQTETLAETQQQKQILQSLSLEMRKIAMRTTQRESCAGLIGQQWLEWLEKHDPKGFTWENDGSLLINAQYMPESENVDPQQIVKLIIAAQGWVKKC